MISHDRGLMRAMRLLPKASLAAQGHSLEGTPPILGFTKHSHCVSYEMQLMQRPVGSKGSGGCQHVYTWGPRVYVCRKTMRIDR